MRASNEMMDIVTNERKKKGISLSKLAAKIGIAKSSLSRYEHRQREFPVNLAGKFADALGISVVYLLGISDDYELTSMIANLDSNQKNQVKQYIEQISSQKQAQD